MEVGVFRLLLGRKPAPLLFRAPAAFVGQKNGVQTFAALGVSVGAEIGFCEGRVLCRVLERGIFRRRINGILLQRGRGRGLYRGIFGRVRSVPHAVVDAGDKAFLEIGLIFPADAAILFLHHIDRRNGNFQHFGIFDFFVHKKISFFLSVSFCFNL